MADEAQVPPEMPDFTPPPIDEIVTHEVVETIVKSADPDLELLDFSAELGSAAGDNYMSIMYAVAIDVKSRKTGEKSTLKIMLKTMPRHPQRQMMINEMNAFGKESKMYDEVFPAFIEFQKECGLSGDDLFTEFPRCYATLCNGKSDYLALEDMRPKGFKMGNRHKGLDFDHCKVVMKNMAKFHAISFAMFKGDFHAIKTRFPIVEEKMAHKAETCPEMYKMFFLSSFKKQAELLQNNGCEQDAKVFLALARDEYLDEQYRLIAEPVANAVVGHGDCWTNNFLFKYDKNNKPTEFKFLDFQLSRVSSRTIDLGYFLYTSPEIDIINNRMDELLRIYYDEFTSFAKKMGYENKELTFDKLLEEFQEFRLNGVVMGLLLAPAVSALKEDVPDLEKMSTEFNEASVDEFLGSWLKGDAVLNKLVNLTKNHAPKVDFIMDYVKKI